MEKSTTFGLTLFIGGLILLLIYGLYLGFGEIVKSIDLITGFLGFTILVGLIILIISIIVEQKKDKKKILEKIDKEDLKP